MNRALIELAVIVVICLLAGVAGASIAAHHYKPKLAAAEAKAKEFQDAYESLAATTARQNEAVTRLEADAKARQDDAVKAIAAARPLAATRRDQAAVILRLKPPAGLDPCKAAAEAFDAELAAERRP